MSRLGLCLAALSIFAIEPMASAMAASLDGPPQPVVVGRVMTAPSIDGNLADWGTDGWTTISVTPAVDKDDQNFTGTLKVQFKAVVAGDTAFFAARWADDTQDLQYKNWAWETDKYTRGKERDDMFAVRFYMSGDYDACMLTDKTYQVDIWIWSAGRSNAAGYADDMIHLISTEPLDDAAEHETKRGKMVYIRKTRDAGNPIYAYTRPDRKKFQGNSVPGVEWPEPPNGSLADVKAKGVWKNGYWNLEMSRKLTTGFSEDVAFTPGQKILGAIAVFNKGEAEHKSVSGTLQFQFPQ